LDSEFYEDADLLRAITYLRKAKKFPYEKLPNGFESIINGNGKNLSGGQKQKVIGLARAFSQTQSS
jgi:ABC-type bacteriocin/lantibiotic exporter with double-glycine peptidase domain